MCADLVQNPVSPFRRSAFTLIELLVVIGIIAILASLLLPSLHQGKERAHFATCMNNLRQIGISTQLYTQDHSGRFPRKQVSGEVQPGITLEWNAQYSMGGPDPVPIHCYLREFPPARLRPLNAYMPPSDVYRCPRDQGQLSFPRFCGSQEHVAMPSNFRTIGCSYHYNAGGLDYPSNGGTHQPQADPLNGLSDKAENWVTETSRYILFHEPPARVYADKPVLENPSDGPG